MEDKQAVNTVGVGDYTGGRFFYRERETTALRVFS
jgi:hypothetical protein